MTSADFSFGNFFTSWLLALSADFLDASFLITVSLTMYIPFVGFRDNEICGFFSIDKLLLFIGCSGALVLRTTLYFNQVDPLKWDALCHIGGAMMLLVCWCEVLCKWRRAVYGRSEIASNLGRRMPEERGSFTRERGNNRRGNEIRSIEDGGRAPLAAIQDVTGSSLPPTASNNTTASSRPKSLRPADPVSDTVGTHGAENDDETEPWTFGYVCGRFSHFLMPALLVLFVSAGDGQTAVCSKLDNSPERSDLGLGTTCGVMCSTLLAVMAGGFLKWYLHDRHLLFYMNLVFFGEMIYSAQGTLVATLEAHLPEAGGPAWA